MSVLAFQSQNKFDQCAQFLEDLLSKDYQDGNLIMIVTATGSVSISRRLLELTSPLVRDIVASLPAAGVQKHLALILPDTDTSSVNKMLDLLLTGHTTTTDTMESREGVLSLADCLQVMMEMDSLETLRVGAGEIRVRNIQEMLEPNVKLDNNNLSLTEDTGTDMEEGEKEEYNKICDVNIKFATLPKLGGVSVPVARVKKIFCDQNADVSSTNDDVDVSSCSHGSSEKGTKTNTGRPYIFQSPEIMSPVYIFRPRHPTPDPRWPAEQQLLIGPLPLSVEYTEARSALMPSNGYIIRLFISPNFEVINKEIVKFGYIVYSDPEIPSRLIAEGFVIVGGVKVAVKKMDGQTVIPSIPNIVG